MKPKITDLGEALSKELQEREDDFRDFYLSIVRNDPTLKKLWGFCFEKDLLRKDPDEFYKSRLSLLKQRQISKSDFFYINKLQGSAGRDQRVFYEALKLFTIITSMVVKHKHEAEKAGYTIPLDKLYDTHSKFYRVEAEHEIKEVNYFSLPIFVEEYTLTPQGEDEILEDVCLICFLPPNLQFFRNHFENYTVELLQKSPTSTDITFGNASFVRLDDIIPHRYSEKEYSKHRYTISVEFQGKRQKLLDCSLEEKYKPLLAKCARKLSDSFRVLSDSDFSKDAKIRWSESRQAIQEKFFNLLLKYDESKHAPLAGYLKTRLNSFVIDHYRRESAKKRKIDKTEEVDLVTLPDSETLTPEEQILLEQKDHQLKKIYQRIEDDLPPKAKRFLKILMKPPDAKNRELAKLIGLSEQSVKKYKSYIKQKAVKYMDDCLDLLSF